MANRLNEIYGLYWLRVRFFGIGYMHVFIGNIPGEATLLEIQKFLGNHEMSLNYSALRPHQHPELNSHCLLIKTNSHESADGLIAELNGKVFKEREIVARRYVERKSRQPYHGVDRRQKQLDLNLLFSNAGTQPLEA